MNQDKSSIYQARSYKDIGKFWDTHDVTEYWDDTEAVEFEVAIPPSSEIDTMLPEYDFSQGVCGKHYEAMREGYTVKIDRAGTTVEIQQSPDDSE